MDRAEQIPVKKKKSGDERKRQAARSSRNSRNLRRGSRIRTAAVHLSFFPVWRRQLKRNIAIDYLRSWVTILVVAHHAALAYNPAGHYDPAHYMKSTAPIVDNVRWMPLDLLVGFNEMYFMPLMFLISGLFVTISIERKGAAHFLKDRINRLGIPFVFSVLILSPLAYYPSWLLSDAAGQGSFLRHFLFTPDWSPGPAWFLWVLLAFCAVAAAACQWAPGLMKKLSLPAVSARSIILSSVVLSLIATIPMRLIFPPATWLSLWGPFAFQAWKLPLYFFWFLLGIALGGASIKSSLSPENLKPWRLWLILGILFYLAYATLEIKSVLLTPAWVLPVIQAFLYSLCCAFTCLGSLGMAVSLLVTANPIADSFTSNAYGVYVFHYMFITWTQLCLLAAPLPAAFKFMVTFAVAISASWMLTALLRRTVAARVL